jgi:excisionase family DNA binding protein
MALTAEQAAKRLNRTERTVRRWITEGKLKAFHPTHGRIDKYLVEESEVEKLAQELAQYEQPGHKQEIVSEDITKEIEKLRGEVFDLRTSVAALEQLYYKLAGQTPVTPIEALPESLQTQPEALKRGRPVGRATIETPKEIPSGSILYSAFAAQHGVNERTFRDQIDQGKIPAFVRVKPSNPLFKERWLRPEDQRAALEFWQSHETRGFTPCSDCPHEKTKLQNDRETAVL